MQGLPEDDSAKAKKQKSKSAATDEELDGALSRAVTPSARLLIGGVVVSLTQLICTYLHIRSSMRLIGLRTSTGADSPRKIDGKPARCIAFQERRFVPYVPVSCTEAWQPFCAFSLSRSFLD